MLTYDSRNGGFSSKFITIHENLLFHSIYSKGLQSRQYITSVIVVQNFCVVN